jgi:hypothetical protein
MSDIQDDKKTLDNRKSIANKEGVKAPLRDQIDNKLLTRLRKEKFGIAVIDSWQKGNAERSAWLGRQREYLRDWDEFVVGESDGPFQQSSNLHLPTSFTVIKTYHARMLAALLANNPNPKPRRPDAVERSASVQATLEYAVKSWCNEGEGAEGELDRWVWDWCWQGVSTLKVRWDVQFETFVDVVESPEQEINFIEDPETGETFAQEGIGMREQEQERHVKTFDGPMLETVPEEDVLFMGGGGDPQKADLIIQQQWMTASELWTMADRGIFDKTKIKDIIKGGKDYKSGDQSTNIKHDKAVAAGKSQADTEQELDRYRILEVYTKRDVTGSGINSEIIVWVHANTGTELRATYLRRANRAGKRPYSRIEFHKRHGQDYPIGLVEILYPYAKEIDSIHNMRIDAGMVANTPVIFYRAASSINPKTISYEPGTMIPVENPQKDIFVPNFGNRTAFGMQEEQQIQTVIERLTGISDLSLGANSGTQGALRTATGARALQGEANANLDVHLRRLFRGWKRVQQLMLYYMQDRIPEGLTFRLQGDNGQDYWTQIQNRDDIAGDFDFEVDPTSADSNPQIRQDKAMTTFNTVMNPLLIQIGIVGPRQVFEATKDVLKARGIQDWGRFVNEPAEQPVIISPEEEANRVVRGIEVPVQMQADHEGFIAFVEHLFSQPELLGQFSEEGTLALARQRDQHAQMAEALQQLQGQQANLRQMQANAAQSAQQAPATQEGAQIAPIGGQGG